MLIDVFEDLEVNPAWVFMCLYIGEGVVGDNGKSKVATSKLNKMLGISSRDLTVALKQLQRSGLIELVQNVREIRRGATEKRVKIIPKIKTKIYAELTDKCKVELKRLLCIEDSSLPRSTLKRVRVFLAYCVLKPRSLVMSFDFIKAKFGIGRALIAKLSELFTGNSKSNRIFSVSVNQTSKVCVVHKPYISGFELSQTGTPFVLDLIRKKILPFSACPYSFKAIPTYNLFIWGFPLLVGISKTLLRLRREKIMFDLDGSKLRYRFFDHDIQKGFEKVRKKFLALNTQKKHRVMRELLMFVEHKVVTDTNIKSVFVEYITMLKNGREGIKVQMFGNKLAKAAFGKCYNNICQLYLSVISSYILNCLGELEMHWEREISSLGFERVDVSDEKAYEFDFWIKELHEFNSEWMFFKATSKYFEAVATEEPKTDV